MDEFVVRWEIELSAESAEDAARYALAVQKDTASTANYFEVAKVTNSGHGRWLGIDLDLIDESA
jgi:hypothetical protein